MASVEGQKPTYYLAFDSNSLRGDDKTWLRQGIEPFININCNDPRLKLFLRLPEVVFEEWIHHYVTIAKKQLGIVADADRFLENLKVSRSKATSIDDDELRKNAEAAIRNLGFETISTPFDEIDFSDFQMRAVKHLPPFASSEKDDGYKDALLAETLKSFGTKLAKNYRLVIITNDGTLKKYLQEIKNNSGLNLDIYDSLDEFQSSLNSHLNKVNEHLTEKATLYFYNPDKAEGYFYKGGFSKKLLAKYDEDYRDLGALRRSFDTLPNAVPPDLYMPPTSPLPGGTKLLPSGREFSISKSAVFIEKLNKRLVWESTVVLSKIYELDYNSQNVISESPGKVTHRVEYKIRWSTTTTKKNNLTSPKLVSITRSYQSKVYNPTRFQSGLDSISEYIKRAGSPLTTASGLATISAVPSDPGFLQSLSQLGKQAQTLNGIAHSMTNLDTLRNTVFGQLPGSPPPKIDDYHSPNSSDIDELYGKE